MPTRRIVLNVKVKVLMRHKWLIKDSNELNIWMDIYRSGISIITLTSEHAI